MELHYAYEDIEPYEDYEDPEGAMLAHREELGIPPPIPLAEPWELGPPVLIRDEPSGPAVSTGPAYGVEVGDEDPGLMEDEVANMIAVDWFESLEGEMRSEMEERREVGADDPTVCDKVDRRSSSEVIGGSEFGPLGPWASLSSEPGPAAARGELWPGEGDEYIAEAARRAAAKAGLQEESRRPVAAAGDAGNQRPPPEVMRTVGDASQGPLGPWVSLSSRPDEPSWQPAPTSPAYGAEVGDDDPGLVEKVTPGRVGGPGPDRSASSGPGRAAPVASSLGPWSSLNGSDGPAPLPSSDATSRAAARDMGI